MVGDAWRRSKPTALLPTKLPLIMFIKCWENVVFTHPDEVRLLIHKILWNSERQQEISNLKSVKKDTFLRMEWSLFFFK